MDMSIEMDGSGSRSATWRRCARSRGRAPSGRPPPASATRSRRSPSRSRRSSAPSGERLVERPGGPRRVSLTEAGEVLLRHAERVVAGMEAAWADLQALSAGEAGTLRVGTYQSVGARILPDLMRRFVAERPGVEVHLTESTFDQELLDQVERGETDLTFTVLPFPGGPFETVELMRDPYLLVVAADSPLARRRRPAEPRGAGQPADHRHPPLLRGRAGGAVRREPGGRAEGGLPLRRQRHGPGPGGRRDGGRAYAGPRRRAERRAGRGARAAGAAAAADRPRLAQSPRALARRAHVHRVRGRALRRASTSRRRIRRALVPSRPDDDASDRRRRGARLRDRGRWPCGTGLRARPGDRGALRAPRGRRGGPGRTGADRVAPRPASGPRLPGGPQGLPTHARADEGGGHPAARPAARQRRRRVRPRRRVPPSPRGVQGRGAAVHRPGGRRPAPAGGPGGGGAGPAR